ncbi:hypothetical protein Ciccas_003095 [Cichlidogyrus casuarinus]|uniref:Ubiquitin-like domain-containing protein n=1 Tax=Cichlidogyrus casuarinus TaxID=1844966 RepID=A0ABD2QFK2_9PLAT
MEVYLSIRRDNQTILLDAKETTLVRDIKQVIQNLLRVDVSNQMLMKDDKELDDNATLAKCDLTSQSARAQAPALLGLRTRNNEDEPFEPLKYKAYSDPPELPDVMKCQESNSQSQMQEKI